MLIRKKGGPVVRENRKNGVLYFTFPSLEETGIVVHAFSSRIGGVSEGEFSSLNLSFSRGDDPERVRENYRRLGDAVGFSPEQLVLTYQTHTTNVREATEADCGKGFSRERDYTDTDGFVTNRPGVALAAFFADCVPLFFVDPVHRAIGLSHSGWRGTVQDIAGATVRKLRDCYGSRPEELIAAVGPSICRDCYEVGEDVAAKFRANYPEELWPSLLTAKETPGSQEKPDTGQKYLLDLWEACRQNLLRAGLLPEHISVTDVCTCCNPGILFSHRASKGRRGNLGAFLMLRE